MFRAQLSAIYSPPRTAKQTREKNSFRRDSLLQEAWLMILSFVVEYRFLFQSGFESRGVARKSSSIHCDVRDSCPECEWVLIEQIAKYLLPSGSRFHCKQYQDRIFRCTRMSLGAFGIRG
jgi:hypothetical protein